MTFAASQRGFSASENADLQQDIKGEVLLRDSPWRQRKLAATHDGNRRSFRTVAIHLVCLSSFSCVQSSMVRIICAAAMFSTTSRQKCAPCIYPSVLRPIFRLKCLSSTGWTDLFCQPSTPVLRFVVKAAAITIFNRATRACNKVAHRCAFPHTHL